MPAKSDRQKKAAGAALAAKRGETPKAGLQGPAKQMLSMSEKQLTEFAAKPKSHKSDYGKHRGGGGKGKK